MRFVVGVVTPRINYRKWRDLVQLPTALVIVYAWPDRAMASETPAKQKVTNSIDLSSVSNGVAGGVETVSSQSIVRRGSSSSASWRVKWRWKILEVAVLSCIIVAAWGLGLAPTIVYALPPQQVSY